MTRQLDKQTLPGTGTASQPPGRNTLPQGSGDQPHPDSFNDTLQSAPHGKVDLYSVLADVGGDPEDPAPDTPSESGRMFETHAGALLGTPAYMSPEQADGKPADERSDIYALCVMFHELLCLKHYLSDKTSVAEVLASIADTPVPNAAFVKSPHQTAVPADLHHFVKVGVAKDPADRYQDVQSMLDRLDRRAEGDIPVECPMTAIKVTTNRFTKLLDSRPTFVLISVLLGLIGGVSLIVYAIRQATSG